MPEGQKRLPIVFLGLSLGEAEARGILPADYRGPVRAGDLDAIEAPADVLVIDGLLEPGCSLELQEVERALDRGIRLTGAASLGAVLASQLEGRGMVGSGLVFEVLRHVDGCRRDLVQVLYAADTLRPLTVPLVHVLVEAWNRGCSPSRMAALADALRTIPVDSRTWGCLRAAAVAAGLEIDESCDLTNFKRVDACRALIVGR